MKKLSIADYSENTVSLNGLTEEQMLEIEMLVPSLHVPIRKAWNRKFNLTKPKSPPSNVALDILNRHLPRACSASLKKP